MAVVRELIVKVVVGADPRGSVGAGGQLLGESDAIARVARWIDEGEPGTSVTLTKQKAAT